MAQIQATLAQLPPFEKLDQSWLQLIEEQSKLLRFSLGQTLSSGSVIPSQVLVLLEGSARLVAEENGQMTTLGKFGAGSLIGLASLLRAEACEEVTASTGMVALGIPDELIIQLHQECSSFREWCSNYLFPAEAAALLDLLIRRSPRSGFKLSALLGELLQHGGVCDGTSKSLEATPAGHALLVASANIADLKIGDELERHTPLPEARPPLPARVIHLSRQILEKLQSHEIPGGLNLNAGSPLEITPGRAAVQAPEQAEAPVASALDLGRDESGVPFRLIRGEGPVQSIQACFQMLCRELDVPFRRDSIEKVVRDCLRRGQTPNLQLCGALASSLGLHVSGGQLQADMGVRLEVPALVAWKGSFAVARRSDARGLELASPEEGLLQIPADELPKHFPEGLQVLLVERTTSTPEQRFGLSWFLPSLRRYRGALVQVLIASFVVQLFSLANPLLIQVIIDKVITQRSLDTLQVLGIGLVVVTLMEGVIGALRTFLFTETTNRIDSRLGAEVIDHLLRLPLNYFDKRPVGELSTRVGELEKIRNFLTGQALSTLLDAAFSVIYIIVMALYSWLLTIVALGVVPIQIAITLLGAPLFRRQTRETAQDNAKTQSHLVEVLSGIQTVKAQNVEIVSRWKWQEFYQRYISHTFEKTVTGTAINQVSTVLQKLSQLLVLWVGAALVLQGTLTLGQLIAFRIISGYVTQPLLRLSMIWQSIQELKVSFERLADVVDTPEESSLKDQANIPLPTVQGDVRFEGITFGFRKGSEPVLKNVTLDVPRGTFVGIVGQSGSGKSTLMKLLPRLYEPDSGRILINGYDISKVELYSLRRQIGIVPQDPLLFSGTVSENIALTNPECDSDAIVQTAQVACAHEFIMQLPDGYSTDVGERGSALSGGQRQRLAIARTLLSNPQMLVMDEATSALDYETEREVCDRLREHLKGCTVFFITHRLNTIKQADVIVMMHRGAVAEVGSHEELMQQRGRYYALFRQQESQ